MKIRLLPHSLRLRRTQPGMVGRGDSTYNGSGLFVTSCGVLSLGVLPGWANCAVKFPNALCSSLVVGLLLK